MMAAERCQSPFMVRWEVGRRGAEGRGWGASCECRHVRLAKFQLQLGKVRRTLLLAPLPANNEMQPTSSWKRQQNDGQMLHNSARLADDKGSRQAGSSPVRCSEQLWRNGRQPHGNKNSFPNSEFMT